MNLISFLDLVGSASLLFALWTILQPEVRSQKIFIPLLSLVVLFGLNVFPNAVEWMGYRNFVEPFETYIQILTPVAFFLVFSYVNFAESEHVLSARNRVLMALHAVSQKLQAGSQPEDIWKDLLERVIRVMGFDGGFIDFPEDRNVANIRVEWRGWDEFDGQARLIEPQDTVLGEVLMSGEATVVDQVKNMPDFFCQALGISGVQSAAFFPVCTDAETLGIMGIVSRSQYTFTPEEVDLFTMMGRHFGEIISNSVLLTGVQEQARELQEALDARRHFLAIISDDLKGPLQKIRTVIQRLTEEVDPEEDAIVARMLKDADADSFKLERIIEDVKELSLLDSGGREVHILPVDIIKEMERVAEMLQNRALDKELDLRIDFLEPLPPVEADRDMIHSALRHLVTNAIKYTPSGGSIVLSAAVEEESVTVRVADTGIGVDEEDAEKIFDMFYRTTMARTREKIGTGLGLTIVRRIARMHHGDVTFQLRPEGGTVFCLKLPKLQMGE